MGVGGGEDYDDTVAVFSGGGVEPSIYATVIMTKANKMGTGG